MKSSVLGDIAEVINGDRGKNYPSGDAIVDEGIPFINAGHLDGGEIDLEEVNFIEPERFDLLRSGKIEGGDILFCIRGSLGKLGVVPNGAKGAIASSLVIIRPSSEIEQSFLRHFLSSPLMTQQIERRDNGTAQPNLGAKVLGSFEIPLPTIEEQRRIAMILDAADALRAKRRQALAKLDTLTQAIFIDMFGDPVSNPQGFMVHELDEICDGIFDCPHSTPKWTDEGDICLRTPNLGKGVWNWSDTRYVARETFAERSRRAELASGDIVLSREGTVGVAAIVPEGAKLCMGQRLVQVRPDDEHVMPEFLLEVLLYLLEPERIARVMVGSTAKHLNVKDLRKLRIPIPSLEQQRVLADRATDAESAISKQRVHEVGSDNLFASLQQRAFRGEL